MNQTLRGLIFRLPEDRILKTDDETARMVHVVEAIKPAIKVIHSSGDHREFVVCSMLDRKVIYASTLGIDRRNGHGAKPMNDGEEAANPVLVKASDDGDLSTSNPVRFTLMTVEPVNSYQIGRLVERICAMGVARTAALRNLSGLRQVGRSLIDLGFRVDDFVAKLHFKKQEDAENADNRALQKSKETIFQFKQNLEALNFAGENQRIVQGGIAYRVSRSRYYANLIETRLKDLRIGRVDGWQPYDEFLRRRLFQTFRFIDDIGDRVSSLRARIDSLIGFVETVESKDHLEEANKLLKQMNDASDIQEALTKKQGITNWLMLIITICIGFLTAVDFLDIRWADLVAKWAALLAWLETWMT